MQYPPEGAGLVRLAVDYEYNCLTYPKLYYPSVLPDEIRKAIDFKVGVFIRRWVRRQQLSSNLARSVIEWMETNTTSIVTQRYNVASVGVSRDSYSIQFHREEKPLPENVVGQHHAPLLVSTLVRTVLPWEPYKQVPRGFVRLIRGWRKVRSGY